MVFLLTYGGRARFVAEAAQRAATLVRRRKLDGVCLAAPPRLIGPLRPGRGRAAIAGVLGKVLTRTPDRALHAWLAGPSFPR